MPDWFSLCQGFNLSAQNLSRCQPLLIAIGGVLGATRAKPPEMSDKGTEGSAVPQTWRELFMALGKGPGP